MDKSLKKNYEADTQEREKVSAKWKKLEDAYTFRVDKKASDKSRIVEGALTTLISERSVRVMA